MSVNRTLTVNMAASDFFKNHDVILTDYESLRKGAMYSRTHWYRIVLDECQEIKVATKAIAEQVFIDDIYWFFM